jgi:hypothetical protein
MDDQQQPSRLAPNACSLQELGCDMLQMSEGDRELVRDARKSEFLPLEPRVDPMSLEAELAAQSLHTTLVLGRQSMLELVLETVEFPVDSRPAHDPTLSWSEQETQWVGSTLAHGLNSNATATTALPTEPEGHPNSSPTPYVNTVRGVEPRADGGRGHSNEPLGLHSGAIQAYRMRWPGHAAAPLSP